MKQKQFAIARVEHPTPTLNPFAALMKIAYWLEHQLNITMVARGLYTDRQSAKLLIHSYTGVRWQIVADDEPEDDQPDSTQYADDEDYDQGLWDTEL